MNQIQRALKMNPGRVIKKLCCFEEIYTIAYRRRDGKSLLGSNVLSFTRVPYHNEFWYADPILITYRGDTYLFAECFDMRTQKGMLGCAGFDENGCLSAFHPVIEESYHLSFPMIFEWQDALYMIPESSDNMSLNLYRCEGDILHWEKVREFPTEKPLVDTVILACKDDTVELLGSAIHPEDPLRYQWQRFTLKKNGELFSLYENDIFNANEEYTYCNRMAGKIVEIENTKIMPTQESTETDYGINLYLNDFTSGDLHGLAGKKITVDDICVAGVDSKQMIGIHSYAATEQLEVVDVRYFRFSPRNRWRKIVVKLKRKILR